MKNILLIFCGIIILAGCSKVDLHENNEKEINSFTMFVGKDSISFIIGDSTIEGIKPDSSGRAGLVAQFTFKGKKVSIAGTEQLSGSTQNDFSKPLIYTVTAQDGSTRNYTVKLKSFTGLPIIYITSPPVSSKDVYVNGSMIIDGNMDYDAANFKIQIKGRGNSTWGQPKNPYKIKLSGKAALLGMPADKEWALLANYFDKSLLRNDIALQLSELMGMTWTPRRRFVEVFMNGEFEGNYLLTETVEVGKDRLNINTMDQTNMADTTNGYLMEADWQQQAVQTFVTPNIVKFSMKEPEVVTAQQIDYIYRQTVNIENQTHLADADLSKLIDVDSWIKWTIVNEVMRNRDAILYGSAFFYQGTGRKVFMGPVWDSDLSAGGYSDNVPTDWYVTTSKIVGWAFTYNDAYRARFKVIWNEYKKQISSLPAYLDSEKKRINLSQQQNFKRWPIMSAVLFDSQLAFQSYDEECNHLRDFLAQRISWMDREVNK